MPARIVLLFLAAGALASAQPAQFSTAVRLLIKIDAPVVSLTNVRVIDGTGGPAKENQTLVLRGGNIAEMGEASRVKAPEGATVIDLTGKSVIPEAGGSRRDQWRSVEDDRRRAEGRDGVQAGRGVRSGQADCRGIRQGGPVVNHAPTA